MRGELEILGARLTPVGLVLPPDLDFQRWQELGEALGWLHRTSRWALGDWLVFGERAFGELAAQASDATGLSYQGLADIASVARRVALSRRRESLSFAAHREVAAPRDLREITTGKRSMRERIEEAAREVWIASKQDGERYVVPLDPMRKLASLLDDRRDR